MSFSHTIENRIDESRRGVAYRNYLEVRNAVFAMLNADEAAASAPSRYWKEELRGMEYLFDASPLIVETLRHHCYHLTGQREFDYRRHHAFKAGPLERRLEILKSQDRRGLFIPESSALGGFGFEIDGALVNSDTLKFYEGLIAMEDGGILENFKNGGEGKTVLEIGGGWGGFAYQFKKIFPNAHYVIVDFPAALLFSGTYLKTVFDDAKIFLSGGGFSFAEKIDPRQY
ncbi:MAG: putative sugar O-methyltransferase, partial [Patescibacteria group bacterium]